MFRTQGRKIVRDIRARKGRSVLVILSILIGVFGVTTMTSITDLVNHQLETDIRSDQISHTKINVISGDETLSAEQNRAFLDSLQRQLPDAVDVEGQAVYPVVWQQDDELADAVLFAFSEPFGEGNLETVSRLVDGRYPAVGVGEIAVEPRFAEANNLDIGDTLRFPNTGDQEWEIVGLLLHPYFIELVETQSMVRVEERILANYEDARQIVGFTGLSAIHVRYKNTQQSIEGMGDLLAAIGRETPYIAIDSSHDDPDENFLATTMSEFAGAMSALGILSMIVSGFLVTNVMNTIIVEQRRQIGAMKALGANLFNNFQIYAGMAFVYGLIGTALGLLLAAPFAAMAARPLATQMSVYIEGYKISPVGLGIGAVMGIIVPVLAAVVPVWQASKVSILDAVTDLGIASDWGRSRLARIIGRLPLPLIASQAVRNIWQKKGRLTLTMLTLAVAGGAFIGATILGQSLNGFVDRSTGVYNYEIRVTPQRAENYEQLTQLIRDEIEDVDAIYPGLDVLVSIPDFSSKVPLTEGSNQVAIFGFDPSTPTYNFDLREGTGWDNDATREGIVVSRPVADALDMHVGEVLTFIVNNQQHTAEIIGIDAYVLDAIFMDWQELAHISGYLDDYEQPQVGTAFVRLHGDTSH